MTTIQQAPIEITNYIFAIFYFSDELKTQIYTNELGVQLNLYTTQSNTHNQERQATDCYFGYFYNCIGQGHGLKKWTITNISCSCEMWPMSLNKSASSVIGTRGAATATDTRRRYISWWRHHQWHERWRGTRTAPISVPTHTDVKVRGEGFRWGGVTMTTMVTVTSSYCGRLGSCRDMLLRQNGCLRRKGAIARCWLKRMRRRLRLQLERSARWAGQLMNGQPVCPATDSSWLGSACIRAKCNTVFLRPIFLSVLVCNVYTLSLGMVRSILEWKDLWKGKKWEWRGREKEKGGRRRVVNVVPRAGVCGILMGR